MDGNVLLDAMEALQYHKLNPEILLQLLVHRPTMTFTDEHQTQWTFISRQQTRQYLLAKTAQMERFMEIYSAPLS